MKNKKNFFEKVVLIVLFILSIPFVLAIYLLFFIMYLIIYPMEISKYKKSIYYKELNEKYYLLITKKDHYKLYNEIRKTGNIIILNNQNLYYNDDYVLIPIMEDIYLDSNKIWQLKNESLDSYLKKYEIDKVKIALIKRDFFLENNDYKLAYKDKNFLIWEKWW